MYKFIVGVSLFLLTSLNSFAVAPEISFAPDVDPSSIERLHPKLQEIAKDLAKFAKKHKIKLVITSTIRSKTKNKAVGAQSDTHVEGRAFDVSIQPRWGWTDNLVKQAVKEISIKYKEVGALTSNGKQVVILAHSVGPKGGLKHIHVQVHRNLPWK